MRLLSNFIPFPFKDAQSCFPLVWPWRQCNPRAPRLMLFLLFPPVFVFLRSTKRLRLLFMLSSRWPKPCLHCWRCSIISSNVSNKITFFLLDHKITQSETFHIFLARRLGVAKQSNHVFRSFSLYYISWGVFIFDLFSVWPFLGLMKF